MASAFTDSHNSKIFHSLSVSPVKLPSMVTPEKGFFRRRFKNNFKNKKKKKTALPTARTEFELLFRWSGSDSATPSSAAGSDREETENTENESDVSNQV